MTPGHEQRPLCPAPGVPRGGAPAQLQRRRARARRLAVRGEPGGPPARGAAARGAPRPHDAQRGADGRRAGASSRARAPALGADARGARPRSRPSRGRPSGGFGCRCRAWPCPFVITPVLPTFRARHPRVEVEVVLEDRFVDIVAEGYDAGVRLSEAIERDMVQVRLTDAFRFVVVGAPSYLARHGTPQRPEDLLRHECITFRCPDHGCALRLGAGAGPQDLARAGARGRRHERRPVMRSLAEQGFGLTYAFEPRCRSSCAPGGSRRARGLRAHRARLLPLLPQPRAALAAAAPVRRGGEGAGGASTLRRGTAAAPSEQLRGPVWSG